MKKNSNSSLQALPESKSEHPRWLQKQIENLIPLTRKTGFFVDELSTHHIVLFVPLSPNVNDKSTLFGGVSSMLLTLAGWGLLSYRMMLENAPTSLVIARSETQYTAPMKSSGAYVRIETDEEEVELFIRRVLSNDRARIDLQADLFDLQGVLCSWQVGSYVSLPEASSKPSTAPADSEG